MLFIGQGMSNKFGDISNFTIKMGDNVIEKTEQYKYLGIIFDDKLSWKSQIDKMCGKLSSVCGTLSKVRHYLDCQSLMHYAYLQ